VKLDRDVGYFARGERSARQDDEDTIAVHWPAEREGR
jgi:hypothetical protein